MNIMLISSPAQSCPLVYYECLHDGHGQEMPIGCLHVYRPYGLRGGLCLHQGTLQADCQEGENFFYFDICLKLTLLLEYWKAVIDK